MDDRFQFDGIWYVLVRNETTNNYVSVGYADNKDNQLIEIFVTNAGYAEYKPWGLTFQFTTTGTNAWKRIQVVKKHQSDVIDRLKSEWCEFDGWNIDFDDPDKTYDWYLANEILRIQNDHVTEGMKLANLGSGILYNGGLNLVTMPVPKTECRIQFRNELQNEDVLTVIELVKEYDGNEYVQFMGTLFDRDMKLDSNRMFRGTMSEGLAQKNATSGEYAIFVKDIGSGLNNVNTAWTSYGNWNSSNHIELNVATGRVNDDTQ